MGRSIKCLLTALATAACCLVGVAWLASSERAAREQDLERETQVVAYQFSTRLRTALEKHLIALQQMAGFFENSDEVSDEEFYDYAAGTLKQVPSCLRVSRLDASLRITAVFPPEANRTMVGFDTRLHAVAHQAIVTARDARQAVFSPPIQLLDGPRGFLLAVPIYRKGRFAGEVVGTVRGADFVGALRLHAVHERYDETVLNSGQSLLPGAADGADRPPDGMTVAKAFGLGGVSWDVRVTPLAHIVEDRLRSGQAGFWTIGLLLALMAGGAAGAALHYALGVAVRVRTQDEALRQARQRLDGAMGQLIQAEKLTALGELVAGVAHELNNPLAAIMGYLQLLLARDIPTEVKRRLETVYGEAERMAKIVKNLLTFARKHPPEKRHLGLNGILEKTLELKAYHFRVNQIVVETDLAPDLPMTMLDFHQVQQVVINLLNNAEQAMAEKGKGGRLKLRTRVVNGRLEARVADSGPGIPPENMQHIFEPFFTTKKDGRGTGLGLSLCYGIMQEHGGAIRAESVPGHGATLVLEFPIVAPPEAEAKPAEAGAGGARRLSILVVDDEQGVSDFLVELLTSRGHRVNTASDVPEALQKIAREELDLIISDLKMPHGTGRDIYRAACERRPDLARRIVFTTGDGTSQETARFLEETGGQIVAKPCSIQEIESAIARAIGGEPAAQPAAGPTPESRSSSAG